MLQGERRWSLGPGKGTEPIPVRRNVTGCRGKGSNTRIWGCMRRGQNGKQKEPGGDSNTHDSKKQVRNYGCSNQTSVSHTQHPMKGMSASEGMRSPSQEA